MRNSQWPLAMVTQQPWLFHEAGLLKPGVLWSNNNECLEGAVSHLLAVPCVEVAFDHLHVCRFNDHIADCNQQLFAVHSLMYILADRPQRVAIFVPFWHFSLLRSPRSAASMALVHGLLELDTVLVGDAFCSLQVIIIVYTRVL